MSDGTCSKERICELASRIGLSHIAFTDHDCISDIETNKALCARYNIEILQAVEFSTWDYKRNRRVHVLCYLPNDTVGLEQICSKTNKSRFDTRREMALKVTQIFPITLDDVLTSAINSKCIFKQHIMQVLIEAGFATQMYGDLYKELFGSKNGSCTMSYKLPDVYEVITEIKKSGGICVLAHPYTYDSIEFLNEAVGQKLFDGIEVWSSKSNQEQEKYLLDVCVENELIPVGGSDFHGANSAIVCPIGIKPTPNDSIEQIYRCKAAKNK